MKQTENYGLNLLELSDPLSLKPLNENAEKIDAALKAQAEVAAGKLMMATGCYTGNGTRSVTIQTSGFTPRALMLRKSLTAKWGNYNDTHWWLGSDISITYGITATSDTPPGTYEPGEQFDAKISAAISFVADSGSLTWSIPDLPQEYYDVTSDSGPGAMSNSKDTSYEWIAFGTAE